MVLPPLIRSEHDGRRLRGQAAAGGVVLAGLLLIWGLTSRGYFWPVWVVLVLVLVLGSSAWGVLVRSRPRIVRRFHASLPLALNAGRAGVAGVFLTGVWAASGAGYYWPVWALLGMGIVLGAQWVAALVSPPDRAELNARIEQLRRTRAGAVEVQESELRRIERDLHDGAQARLIALGMSLGMAEQKLIDDPARAAELLAEARAGAEQALRELRDLARGIHPPVLADRGLEAAISALVSASPMRVSVSADIATRPSGAVESAAYFVVAEALANAAKHARAEHVAVRLVRGRDSPSADSLVVEIVDDGVGGANQHGSGLEGLRRRVQALDGTLDVTSPRNPFGADTGRGTTVRAELPCAS